MQSATHIAFDPFTPEALLRIGINNVVQVLDRLVIGPYRRDPPEHARARLSWWPATEEWDGLYSPKIRWEPPVFVWVSASILERVNLWRACAWLCRIGLASQDVFILDFDRIPSKGVPESRCLPLTARRRRRIILTRSSWRVSRSPSRGRARDTIAP